MQRILSVVLSLTAVLAVAQEVGTRLVPRPVPGLVSKERSPKESTDPLFSALKVQRARPNSAPAMPVRPQSSGATQPVVMHEPARILFVHRHNQLPAAMQQRLKAFPAAPSGTGAANPSGAVELLQERPAAVRIIPKSEVPLLKTPAAATPQTEAMKP